MHTPHTLIRAAGLALAIAAAFPALADTTVTVPGNTRHYVYYRDHDIYYAPETRTYYWTAGGSWHWGDTLPEVWRGDVQSGGIEIDLDTDRPYERHDYVVAHYKNGAPITSAARRRYVYYRDHDIYYAPESRTYYWMADGNWRSGNALPEGSRGYVTSGGIDIELDTDRPYERNDYVVSMYKNQSVPGSAGTTVSERSVNRDGSVTTTTTTTTPRRYLYYRDQNIYYARESDTYYWRRNGTWESGHTLPAEWRAGVHKGGAIEVELDTDRPYEREAYVTEHYLNNRPGNVVTSTSVSRDGTRTTTTTQRSYVYYGDHQIYFSPKTRTYYWLDNGKWRSGSRLPYSLRSYAKNGVNIELDTDRPYERHAYVIARYKDGVYRDERRNDD